MAKERGSDKKDGDMVSNSDNRDFSGVGGISRRTLLKALAGVPVLGALGISAVSKWNYEKHKSVNVIRELGLDDLKPRFDSAVTSGSGGDVLRLGFIGFGNRAHQLASGLGFLHPSEVERRRNNGALENWLEQEDLNIALTGICDVFDLHAEAGLATARSDIRPGGGRVSALPVRRYGHYREMLDDKDIDAVIIATPDHHHARMTIDAARAGKHIYCEKSVALLEDELYELYDTVRASGVVYQLGHQITQNVVYKQAREIIDKGVLGKITLIETTSNRNTASGAWIRHLDSKGNPKPGDEKSIDWLQWLGDTPYKPFSTDLFYNWTLWFDYAQGLITQLFTHEYDAINQVLRIGIPASAISSGGLYYWKDDREMPDVLNCIFEYPDLELSLKYSGNLASSRSRGRIIMGHDASMELGSSVNITIDRNSTRYKRQIGEGLIDTSVPVVTLSSSGKVDAVTSATERYYASRGLMSTTIGGRQVDITHLHLKEWLSCIRKGGVPSTNIEMAFEEGVTCIMAHKSYVEKRRVEWDPVKRRIV